MKFYINQKFMTLVREKFTIIDENQTPHFYVEGQALWGGKRLSIFDMQGNLVFKLKRRLMRLFTTIDILNAQDEQLARFKQRFHIGFKKKFTVLTATGMEYSLIESWLATEFTVFRLQEGTVTDKKGNESVGIVEVPVVQVNRKLFQFGDKYQVEILDNSEIMMGLAIILCNDMARQHRAQQNNN